MCSNTCSPCRTTVIPARTQTTTRSIFRRPSPPTRATIRLDRAISSRQTAFARFSYKNRQVLTAPSSLCTYTYCAEAGSPLQGPYNTPEIDEGLTFAHNFIISSNAMNEFRGGYNEQHTSETQNYSTVDLLSQIGITVPQPNLEYSEAPQVLINGFMSTGAGNPGVQRGQVIELLDNLTWTHHNHTFKFGADFKRLSDHDDNVFGNYRSGWYVFNSDSSVGTAIGDPYAAFLLGYPDYTSVSTTNNPTMDGLGHSYAFYGQDDWKLTRNLTLNAGLRYELHPPLREIHSNTAAFMPDWTGVGADGATGVNGAVVVSDDKGLALQSADFAAAISPTPILTAAQVGIPSALRYTDHSDFGPRIGFAWRPKGKDTTVLRGGWGRFIQAPLGFSLVSGWAVASSYVATYNQDVQSDGVTPLLDFTNPFNTTAAGSAYGTAGFYYAFPIHYRDPIVQQWNLTFEQELGRNIGMRLSYAGSHGQDLEAMVDLNQVEPNTLGYENVADNRPYPAWSVIQSVANAAESNYNSGTAEVSRHSGKGITSMRATCGRATSPTPAALRPTHSPSPAEPISPTASIPDSTMATWSTTAGTAFSRRGSMIFLSVTASAGSRAAERSTDLPAAGRYPASSSCSPAPSSLHTSNRLTRPIPISSPPWARLGPTSRRMCQSMPSNALRRSGSIQRRFRI